jgi:hypothetical protein
MATEQRILDVSYPAAEDLNADQFKFVVLDAGKVRRPNSGTERALGVLQNKPEANQAAQVRTNGITKLVAGGAITENAQVKAEYVSAADAGKGVATTTSGDKVRGLCVAAASAEDALCSVRLVDFQV